uniref:Uncharacterized protein n=1 Tax=Nothobranchius furzeri TaxID=105023 RepID=A0A1A8UBL5_NOTFU
MITLPGQTYTLSSWTGRTLESTPPGSPTPHISQPLPWPEPPPAAHLNFLDLHKLSSLHVSLLDLSPCKPLNLDRTTPPSNQFPPLQTASPPHKSDFPFLPQTGSNSDLSTVFPHQPPCARTQLRLRCSLGFPSINPYLNLLNRLRSDSVCRGLVFFTTT